MATIQELVFRISATSDQLSRELAKGNQAVGGFADNVNRRLDQVENKVKGLGTTFAKTNDVIDSFKGALAALGVTVGLREIGNALVDAAVKFDRLNTQLSYGTGSAEGAKAAYAQLQQLADKLGLSFDATARSFASFSAATRGTSIQGAETEKIFNAVAEAAGTLKLSTEDTEGVFLALSQMVSKGTVQAEELRGQLGERLPGAFALAAKALGVTTAQLGKMLQQGQVVTSDFLPKFADELHNTFGVTAVAAADSAGAAINRLDNAWGRLLNTVTSADAVKGGTNFLTNMVDTVNQVLQNLGRTDNLEAKMDAAAALQRQIQMLQSAQGDLDRATKNGGDADFIASLTSEVDGLKTSVQEALKAYTQLLGVDKAEKGRRGIGATAPTPPPAKTAPPQSSELTNHLRDLNVQLDNFSRPEREQAIANALKGFENTTAADQIRKLAGAIYDAQQAQEQFAESIAEGQNQEKDLLSRASAVIQANQLPIEAYKAALRNLTELLAQGEISQDQYNRAVTAAARSAFPQAEAAIEAATGQTEDLRQTVLQLNEALSAGIISQDEWNKAVDKMADSSKDGKTASEQLKDASKDATSAISTGLEDAILNGKTLDDVLQGLIKTLAQIALRVAVTKPLEGFAGDILGKLTNGGLSSSIDDLISSNPDLFANGGIMTSRGKVPLKKYAGGGIARSAQLAMYGEGSKPEAIIPLPDGRSVPVSLQGGGAGGGDINISAPITVNGGGGSDEENANLAKQIHKEFTGSITKIVDARLVAQSRSGGLLNRGGPQ